MPYFRLTEISEVLVRRHFLAPLLQVLDARRLPDNSIALCLFDGVVQHAPAYINMPNDDQQPAMGHVQPLPVDRYSVIRLDEFRVGQQDGQQVIVISQYGVVMEG